MRSFFKYTLITIFNISIIAIVGIIYLFFINSKDLPSYEQLKNYQPPIVTRFYSADGKLLEEYAKEHRLFLPISDIPLKVKQAFISAEDKNFYSHPGIDLSGILRAAIKNLVTNLQGKKSLVGGSTITQQVVKNFLLTNEKSLNRKIKEAILAYRITKVFSKDKILELYLNEIFLGARSYGIASASLNYFNKSLSELNLQEAAFLAALPQAPSYYNPHKNLKRALHRRNWVIERMYEDEFITKEEALAAVASPIKLYARDRDEVAKADFFAEEVRQKIAELYGEKSLYEAGLMVRTSLNPELQKIGEEALLHGVIKYDQRHGYRGPIKRIKLDSTWRNNLAEIIANETAIPSWKYVVITSVTTNAIKVKDISDASFDLNISESNWALKSKNLTKNFSPGDVIVIDSENKLQQIPKVNGALVAMDPHTGRVLALVGGYSFNNSKFNRATQAYRQPGSSFKSFVYLAGLENGLAPNTIFEDSPISLEQGPGLPLWKPKNFYNDFLGPITLRRGLELSRNPITVRIAQTIGIDKVAEIAKRFGINHDPKPYYSMVLGAMETTLLRITNAYSIIANGGHKVTPSMIDKIQDRNGKVIYTNDQRKCINCFENDDIIPYIKENNVYVTDPRSAYQLTSLLEGVVQHTKSAFSIRELSRTIAGKTGTTNQAKDTWFIGFTPDLVVGVFIGFDEPKSLGSRESGALVAQPVFVEFMKKALVNQPDKPFKMPDGLKLVKLDYLTGEPTTRSLGSIYEVFKRANYNDNITLSEVDSVPEPMQTEIQTKPENTDEIILDEIREDEVY